MIDAGYIYDLLIVALNAVSASFLIDKLWGNV